MTPDDSVENAELLEVETLIASNPDGIGRQALEAAFAETFGRTIGYRTLLRRLRSLMDQDRVRTAGDGNRLVYVPGPALVLEAPAPEDGYVPISREGARVRALVRRPLMERRPVGYDRGFVEAYRPGKTWYLPRQLREQLHEMGRTPDGERPAGTYAREIFSRLLVDLSWASSRLEGNTYTRLDTLNLLEFGQRADGKELAEAQMILNHKAAIELLVSRADRIGFDLFTFQNLHAALSENLLADPGDEGRLRTRIVEISGTPYLPLAIPQAVEDCFRLVLARAGAIPDPFEQAFFVMVHVPYLQPFADVNKRTSRLGANIPLIKANLCPLSFVDVPERAYVEATLGVYELTRVDLLRDVFVWAYQRSCAQYRVARDAVGEPDPLRMRYRRELGTVVHEMVRAGEPPRMGLIRAWAEEHAVPAADVEAFTERALTLLVSLHEGNLHRYDLRISEFAAWKAKFHAPD
ncbi:Fic family protein [Longimicrobium sp.]|uniref:Fic family protein n=1 Tax=Longimicrobium sp. TaxID=2029185 RepID=UPI002CF2E9C9|nr:Fic family protein [Longimicrobium sp.]HSU17737.1 Fic family protein [Longimicrobium sp.]